MQNTTWPTKKSVEIENPFILLVDKKISNIRELLPVLESVAKSGRPLCIIAEEVEGEAGHRRHMQVVQPASKSSHQGSSCSETRREADAQFAQGQLSPRRLAKQRTLAEASFTVEHEHDAPSRCPCHEKSDTEDDEYVPGTPTREFPRREMRSDTAGAAGVQLA